MNKKPNVEKWIVSEEWRSKWENLEFTEFAYEWVLWEPQTDLMGGGLRLILPKNGKNSFCVTSGERASEVAGVSANYQIKFGGETSLEVSKIISDFTGLSAVHVYKIAKQGTSEFVYISSPFQMLTEVESAGCSIELHRVDDRGGYF